MRAAPIMLDSEQLNAMRALRRDGYSIARIARIFGISNARCFRIVRQLMGAMI
jgi:hypothetical protein